MNVLYIHLHHLSPLKATLFSEHDIEVMFNVFDITRKGSIRKDQYMKGKATVKGMNPSSPTKFMDV